MKTKTSRPRRRPPARPDQAGRTQERTFPEIEPAPGQIDELRYAFSPRLRALATIHEMIEDFGEIHNIGVQIYLVNLEIDELITNYVSYAQHKVQHPRVELRVSLFKEKLVLEVIDTGPAFDPFAISPPDMKGDFRTRKPGGVGLHLVRSYANRMRYECINGCNRLMLEHDLTGQPEEPAGDAKPDAEETNAWQGG